jgi:hypothetical protein
LLLFDVDTAKQITARSCRSWIVNYSGFCLKGRVCASRPEKGQGYVSQKKKKIRGRGIADQPTLGQMPEPDSVTQENTMQGAGLPEMNKTHPVESATLSKAQSKPKSCLGALYFSQARFDRERPPLCAGFPSRLSELSNDGYDAESVPGGHFKYVCIGYSEWDEEVLQRAARQRTASTDPVQLPFCEGLEIVSAAAVASNPELLTPSGGTGDGKDIDILPPKRPPPPRSINGLGDPTSFPEPLDWERLRAGFDRMSRKIVEKMASNAAVLATSVQKTWEDITGRWGGGGGGRRKD